MKPKFNIGDEVWSMRNERAPYEIIGFEIGVGNEPVYTLRCDKFYYFKIPESILYADGKNACEKNLILVEMDK